MKKQDDIVATHLEILADEEKEKERVADKLKKDKQSFLQKIAHRRLKVFDVRCGDIVQAVSLWRGDEYDPHLEPHEVTFIYWDKDVTDYTDYYRPIKRRKT